MIGSYPAALSAAIAITRETVFFNKGKKWASSKLWIVFYGFVFICAAIVTWKDMFNLLPATACTLSTIAFWCTNVYSIKIIVAIYSSLMLIYNIHYCSIAGSLDSAISVCTVLVSLCLMKTSEGKERIEINANK